MRVVQYARGVGRIFLAKFLGDDPAQRSGSGAERSPARRVGMALRAEALRAETGAEGKLADCFLGRWLLECSGHDWV